MNICGECGEIYRTYEYVCDNAENAEKDVDRRGAYLHVPIKFVAL